MVKIQRDIVPILERLQGMFGAGNKLGSESEKVASKLGEILGLLPRLKVTAFPAGKQHIKAILGAEAHE